MSTRTHRNWAFRSAAAFAGAVALLIGSAVPAQDSQTLPGDSEYVVVDANGHLSVGGVRQRYWAAIGKVYANPGITDADPTAVRAQKLAAARLGSAVILDRLEFLGFNAVRLWDGFAEPMNYVPGDGSPADSVDHFLVEARKRGMRIWLAGLNNLGDAAPGDVDVISDASTAAAWREAIASAGGKMPLRNNLARFWDERLESLAIRRMQTIATHVNQHNGLRWCDDPVIAVWELSNEEWWIGKMVGGQWQNLPPLFRNTLIARWNAFLKSKYGDDRRLGEAWNGLLPGERLEDATVVFAPMAGTSTAAASINDANALARDALQGLKQTYTRADFSEQRGRDVMEFLVGLHVSHKQREAAAIKPLGKSTRLSPMIFDTGIGYEIQSQFLHQNADAVAHDAYIGGHYPRLTDAQIQAEVDKGTNDLMRLQRRLEEDQKRPNAGRWVNWLAKPPLIAQGVPWLEHNRVAGKPYFCYETQIMNPAKYRADFPLRLVALASIQDWDFVCWHYFGDESLDRAGVDPRPFEKPLDVTTGWHPQGYHFTYDEVQSAMMRAAGLIFRERLLPPAPAPTKFTFGRDALYDPASMDYAGSYGRLGLDMIFTTYQHGVRLLIDPKLATSSVSGPVVSFDARQDHNPYKPVREITFDWKKAHLKFDAPAAIAFTGLLARAGDAVQFDAGLTLSGVKIHNPAGIFDPVAADEQYIAFAMHTSDGLPFASTRRASLSIVSTSFNTGFALPNAPDGQAVAGTLPVLVARVGATLQGDALRGMRYTFRDWNGKIISEGIITGDRLSIPSEKPIFLIDLTRD